LEDPVTVDPHVRCDEHGGRWRTWRRAVLAVLRGSQPGSTPVPDDARSTRLRKLGEVCAVLDEARALIAHGWVQNNWYALRPVDGGALRTFTSAVPVAGTEVRGACLVGAVVHATRAGDPAAGLAEAGPALDIVWDAWQESRGLNGPGLAGRAVPREVRAARVRDLTRWNDRPGRTREDVLRLLDLASTRAIMEAANTEPVTAVRTR
jgi:hypothetical protein